MPLSASPTEAAPALGLMAGAAFAQSPAINYYQHVVSDEIIKLLGPDSGIKPSAR